MLAKVTSMKAKKKKQTFVMHTLLSFDAAQAKLIDAARKTTGATRTGFAMSCVLNALREESVRISKSK